MTHRKYSRTRNRIHKAMARNPGQRPSKAMRLEQAVGDRERQLKRDKEFGQVIKEVHNIRPQVATPKPIPGQARLMPNRPGFFRRIFNRKTGG